MSSYDRYAMYLLYLIGMWDIADLNDICKIATKKNTCPTLGDNNIPIVYYMTDYLQK